MLDWLFFKCSKVLDWCVGFRHGRANATISYQAAVSAHTKILMDRCQSLWVRKHWLKETSSGEGPSGRKGLFISVGATRGKKLFDGTLLTVRYYLEAIDCELWKSLLYRELDFEGDVLKHPEYLEEAHQAGNDLVLALETD